MTHYPKMDSVSKGWFWNCVVALLIVAVLLACLVYVLTPEERINEWKTFFHEATGWH